MKITKILFSYFSITLSIQIKHYILTARVDTQTILLSYPNAFLHDKTRFSVKTSERYAGVIANFYSYLAIQERFQRISIGHYQSICCNNDIRRWQIWRLIQKEASGIVRPSSETIFSDAKILLAYFDWLNSRHIPHLVEIRKSTWTPNYKSSKLLAYVSSKARQRIDSNAVKVLPSERKQHNFKTLITNEEIKALLEGYSDPVYRSLFMLAIGTAMRPMDLCRFPYIGSGPNLGLLPFSAMNKSKVSPLIDYLVTHSKGNKSRLIKIHVDDLKLIEDEYTKIYYPQRAAKYKDKYGIDCPPSILFLNDAGIPVTPKMISNRSLHAKQLAIKKNPTFRKTVCFYDTRHWWPTQFVIKIYGESIIDSNSRLLNAAAGQLLINQMGHSDITTTLKHYIDMARLLLTMNSSQTTELVENASQSTLQLLEYLKKSGSVDDRRQPR